MNNREDPTVNPVHVTGNFMPVFGRGKGFENVKNFSGGMKEWLAANGKTTDCTCTNA